MTKKIKTKIYTKYFLLLFFIFFSFLIAFGAKASGPLVPCGLNGAADCTLCHLVIGFKNIYDYLFEILLVCTTIVIVAAGIMYMVSSGSKGLIEKAKQAFTYALTAMILALVAWLIINTTLHALGYRNVGNWWTFTCDTAQTTGAGTTGPGGSTLPSSTSTQGTSTTNTAKGDGTCGGARVAQNSDQCNYTSAQLDSVLRCINSRLAFVETKNNSVLNNFLRFPVARAAGGFTVSSLGQNQNGGNWQACIGANYSSSRCPHSQNSCHYGGKNCQGQINAADLTGDMAAAASAARECGADTVIYNNTAYFGGNSQAASDHTDHVHISVNNSACGCDYMR